MELHTVPIDKADDFNVILRQAYISKMVEDLLEAEAGRSSHVRFVVASCEASAACLIRRTGNDNFKKG
jgi:adenosine/AMP kinase